jgi:hypothetical protein
MSEEITAFVIHQGDSWYLGNTFNSLIRAGWKNIVLLGDARNKKYSCLPGVSHIDLSTLDNAEIDMLRQSYRHLAVTPPDYELFCFMRWLYLEAAVRLLNLDKIVLIDSDVLFFLSPREILDSLNWQQPGYYLTLRHNPSCFVASSAPTVLCILARFINAIYTKEFGEICNWVAMKQKARLHSSKSESFYAKYEEALHFSDMDMLQEFWDACNGSASISPQAIDCSINTALLPGLANPISELLFDSNFISLKGKGEFHWKNSRLSISNEFTIASLHFQGMSKRYICIVDAICSAPIECRFLVDFSGSINVVF